MLRKCTCRDKSIHFAFCFQVQSNIICCINHFYFPPILFFFCIYKSKSKSVYNFNLHCHYQSVGQEREERDERSRVGGKERQVAWLTYPSRGYMKITERKSICAYSPPLYHGRDSTLQKQLRTLAVGGNLRAAGCSTSAGRGEVEGAQDQSIAWL